MVNILQLGELQLSVLKCFYFTFCNVVLLLLQIEIMKLLTDTEVSFAHFKPIINVGMQLNF